MSFFDMIRISLIIPCESQLTEEDRPDLPLEFSNFVASEAVGDDGTTARLSEKHYYHSRTLIFL